MAARRPQLHALHRRRALALPEVAVRAVDANRLADDVARHDDDLGFEIAAPALVGEHDRIARAEQIAQLRKGVLLKDGPTQPTQAQRLDRAPDWLWPRDPPIRVRKTVPDSFIEITLREGRNRQVRRMTAAVGLPTLRLVRISIGPHRLDGLTSGQWREEKL